MLVIDKWSIHASQYLASEKEDQKEDQKEQNQKEDQKEDPINLEDQKEDRVDLVIHMIKDLNL